MSKNKKAVEAKQKGNEAFGKENFQEALKQYNLAIKADPKDATFWSNRCATYLKLNKPKEALDDAEQTIKVDPKWPKGYLRKASALVALNRSKEAIPVLQQGVKCPGDVSELQKKLSELQATQPSSSSSSSSSSRQPQPSQPPKPKGVDKDGKPLSPYGLAKEEGNEHYKEGRFDKAIESYSKAMSLASTNQEKATLLANRAACNAQKQMYSEVILDCTQCLEIDAHNVKALLRRGLAYESMEKYKLARQDIQAAMELEPGTKQASEALGRLDRFIRMTQNQKP